MTIVDSNPDPRQVNNWQDIDTSTPEGCRELDKCIEARRIGVPVTFEGEGLDIYVYRTELDELDDIPYTWVRHYSTDLNHAFELADSQTHIRTRRGSQDEQIWGVQLKLQDETYQDTSLAIAICKAWLGWYDWHEAVLARIAAEDTEAHDANGRGAV